MSNTARLATILAIVVTATATAVFFAPRPVVPTTATIAVTSYPLYDIVRSVAGSDLPVSVVLPPGGNPHTFEPTPAAINMLTNAKVVYAVGHGFDDWIDGLLTNGTAAKVTVDSGIALRASVENKGAAEATEEDHDGPIDPHYWLDARNAAQIARTVAADLSLRFPDRRNAIAANLATTVSDLLDADVMIRATLADLPHKDIVTLHDAWYYFADAYALNIVGSFEPSAAREPSPQYLAELEDAVKTAGVSVIYREPGLPTGGLDAFAADNHLRIVELDAIEGQTADGYVAAMLRNATIIKENQR